MDYIPISSNWLIPGEKTPCEIYFYFRGKFASSLKAQEAIKADFFEKLHRANPFFLYIKRSEQENWRQWQKQRHPSTNKFANNAKAAKEEKFSKESLYGNKRAEYLSYVQKCIQARDPNNTTLLESFKNAQFFLGTMIKNPSFDWYFDQFHEPRDLFHHSAELSFCLVLFCFSYNLLIESDLETLIYSAVIHEQEGNPKESLQKIVSSQTLETLEKKKRPVPAKVKALIEKHDELCSGKGFPKALKLSQIPNEIKIFSLCNHFCHYRLKFQGTRRSRFDMAKKAMLARRKDYDLELWDKFWQFVEHEVEFVS